MSWVLSYSYFFEEKKIIIVVVFRLSRREIRRPEERTYIRHITICIGHVHVSDEIGFFQTRAYVMYIRISADEQSRTAFWYDV